MQVWFKFLIVCVIALALPVQGMASVTMAHCMPSDPRLPVAMSASAHHHLADPDSDTDAAAQHRGAAVTSQADAAAVQAHAPSDKSADFAQYECSACASCCAASALPSVMPRVPQPAFAPMVFAETTVTVHAYAADGPDRPPRS